MYSRDHKMDPQQHLPAQWTPVDQEIIEDLLLVEPIAVYETPNDANSGQYALMYHQQQQMTSPASTGDDSPLVHSHASHFAPTRALQIKLMAQGLSPGATGFDGTDDVRKAKHREVQRRFMLRKKVPYLRVVCSSFVLFILFCLHNN